MARNVKIRGWLECESQQITTIEEIVSRFMTEHDRYHLNTDLAMTYQLAWHFPESLGKGLEFVFYGAELHEYYLEYFRDQLNCICQSVAEIKGFFYISEADGKTWTWTISNGKLAISERNLGI